MESVIDGSGREAVSLAVNGMSLDTSWSSQDANNQNVLYIVSYVKDNEFKVDSESEVQQNFTEFDQHVSPLDPNMCSVAQYSPVYSSENSISYNNPIVLVTNNESQEILSIPNNGQIVETELLINESVDDPDAQTVVEDVGNEQEVELLITDQNTGIQYTVTKEYLVERCLADDQHLLENLAPDTLLDSELLALDDNVLKSQFSEIVVEPTQLLNGLVKVNKNGNKIDDSHELDKMKNDDECRRFLRRTDCCPDPEQEMLCCVRPISDKPVPTRAWATLPEPYLIIQNISETEVGVFAKKTIPKLTQFGPLEGTYIESNNISDCGIEFFVQNQLNQVLKIDVSDENNSNWMRFVRPAVTFKEQNLVLVENESLLYFVNYDPILPKHELRVGYSKSYARKYNLKVLPQTVDETNLWPCYECTEKFTSSELLQNHLDVHDDKVDIKIKKKRKKIVQKKEKDVLGCSDGVKVDDKEKHNIVRSFKCRQCKLIFETEDALKTHSSQHLQNNHICEVCGMSFGSVSQLDYHLNMKHATSKKSGKKSFDCVLCSKSFATIERRQKHMLVHGSEESKPLQCDKCSRRFINNSALAYHLKTHIVGRKQFECPICKETFVYVLQLKLHVKQHCIDGQYTCPHCQKLFTKYSIIRKHIRALHCERKHACQQCSKHFPTLDKLRMHLLKHSDHREFGCAECGKHFKRKDKLKEHCQRIHSEERENAAPKFVPKVEPTDYHRFIYKCHTCMVGFKRRGMLVNHLAKRHPDISPNSVPELNLPILRATRDYFCQYCDKVYKSSSKRKAHILKNHPGAALPLSNKTHSSTADLPNPTFSQTVGSVTTHPHSCEFCYKQYASKAKLLQHLRKKHLDLIQNVAQNESKEIRNDEGEVEKVLDDEILTHLGADYQLVSIEEFPQGESDSRLYRLLTTTNNMVPPR
nr:PR domain zinc finger protein 10-like [Onthophagus taurus]